MIKKATALFLILLALSNVIILAHTFIPHHYHKSEVCINNSRCQVHNMAHEHSPVDHPHKHSTTDHDHEHGGEYCISDQVFVIRSNQAKLDHKYLDIADNQSSFNAVTANFTNPELINFLTTYCYNTHPSSVFSTYCQFISSGLGLRAPPSIV